MVAISRGLALCSPYVQPLRTLWSCTFCRMKRSSGSQQCHHVSKILERQMQPQDQLKCEFLLLKAYCHPQSSFSTGIPFNIRDYGEPFQEAMWLDLVKERLNTEVYTVAWFVRDMCLIFRDHKTFHKIFLGRHLRKIFISTQLPSLPPCQELACSQTTNCKLVPSHGAAGRKR
ncbi:PREDICTED: sp110 nuclear body protein-like [Rhinopithecus bieti]|uniref:sp110 nuclear body protein-like n=1 Tax=Rhinopithecus bieti TaxID=61621 RepID=UPI00083BBE4C|nr:PREDICTED: sp110 nuclear body protein-like [Rhinopithecus bieti]